MGRPQVAKSSVQALGEALEALQRLAEALLLPLGVAAVGLQGCWSFGGKELRASLSCKELRARSLRELTLGASGKELRASASSKGASSAAWGLRVPEGACDPKAGCKLKAWLGARCAALLRELPVVQRAPCKLE